MPVLVQYVRRTCDVPVCVEGKLERWGGDIDGSSVREGMHFEATLHLTCGKFLYKYNKRDRPQGALYVRVCVHRLHCTYTFGRRCANSATAMLLLCRLDKRSFPSRQLLYHKYAFRSWVRLAARTGEDVRGRWMMPKEPAVST